MTQSTAKLHTAPRTDVVRGRGGFRTRFDFPGRNLPDHDDHGYGPLATVVESSLDPGTLIGMHPHRNEEIVSWVPDGVMRHDDREGNRLVTDPDHLLVMNAGSGFWHEERTLETDPPLRMLQIFVRPRELDLEPGIQHGPVPDTASGEWRHLFGPEESEAPFTVRNAVDLYDVRLEAGAEGELPSMADRDAYVYVFEGEVEIGDARLDEGESALLVGGGAKPVRATSESVVVTFLIDPDAPVTRQGTIGR